MEGVLNFVLGSEPSPGSGDTGFRGPPIKRSKPDDETLPNGEKLLTYFIQL